MEISHQTSPAEVVIGLDAGGTSTRAAVLNKNGQLITLISGPGANFRSSPTAASQVLKAVAQTIATHLQSTLSREVAVTACVAGVAGAGPAGKEQTEKTLTDALAQADLAPSHLELVPDPLIAFAAASPTKNGVVLLAGTGAVAFRISELKQEGRSDGLGWLLGDTGGGIWLAREGLRAAAAELDGRGEPTKLTSAAADFASEHIESTGDARQDLVRLVHDISAPQWGAFATKVTHLAAEGDPVAERITERAAAELLQTYNSVAPPGVESIVLAGSILTTSGPIRHQILNQLAPREIFDAQYPVIGAARLAAHNAAWKLPSLEDLTREVESTTTVKASPRKGTSAFTVDTYRPEDRDALYDICLRTGDSGGDASDKIADPHLLGHVYLGAYLELEPNLVRVLRQDDGTPVGYCVAAANTAGFEQRSETSWWPHLRAQYEQPASDDDSLDARMMRIIHTPNHTDTSLLADYPAHIHINLLPEAQGGGNGRRLLNATLEALSATGAAGVHLGVGQRNISAIGFYESVGFRTQKHLPWGLIMGRTLPA